MNQKVDLQARISGLTIGTTFAIGVLVEELAKRGLVSKTHFAETLRWVIEEDQCRRPTSVPAHSQHDLMFLWSLAKFLTDKPRREGMRAIIDGGKTNDGSKTDDGETC